MMENRHQIPPAHPMNLGAYVLMGVGVLLFLSNFVGDLDMTRAFGGMGLIAVGIAIRGLAEWLWNNNQPVQSVPARAVSKWTTTSGGGENSTVQTHYHARFETNDGESLDFKLSLHVYKQFSEGDSGTLTFQGSRVHEFQRA